MFSLERLYSSPPVDGGSLEVQNKYWAQKKFCKKNFVSKKTYGSKEILGSQNILGLKTKRNCGFKINLRPKIFEKKILVWKNLASEKYWVQKLLIKKILAQNKFGAIEV